MIRSHFLGLVFTGLFALVPALARAEYICEVELMGATQSSYGDYGYIRFTTTPNPGCSGVSSTYWFCTNKAGGGTPSYSGCAVSLYSRHSVESLPILFSEIARAARDAQSVKVGKSLCVGANAPSTCALSVTFQGF